MPQPDRGDRRADRRGASVQSRCELDGRRASRVNGNTLYFGGDFTTVGTNGTGFSPRHGSPPRTRRRARCCRGRPSADGSSCARWWSTPRAAGSSSAARSTRSTARTQSGMGSLDGVTRRRRTVGGEHRDPEPRRRRGDRRAHDRRREDLRHRLGVLRRRGRPRTSKECSRPIRATGVIDWVDGGRGDNYGIAVTGDVLYTVGHPHDWGMLDWNPQYPTRGSSSGPWRSTSTARPR